MSQPVSPRLQQVVEMVEALSPDEQRQLIEIIRQRLIQYQHAEPAAEVAEARQAYQELAHLGPTPQAYRAETLASDGTLTIKGLPFHAGDKVEVIVRGRRRKPSGQRYPLCGIPIRYIGPFESVAE